jgi:hypothetical protein
MTEANQALVTPLKKKRERSPSFPFIPLKTAIERLTAFDEFSKRHPVPAKHSGAAWGFKGFTSQAQQTLAALKSFGLIEYQGSGENLVAVLSEDGRLYLRSQQESVKHSVLKRVALKPKAIAKYFSMWGVERPNDAICLDELVLKGGFYGIGGKTFLSVYDDTIAYAKLTDSDKIAPREGGEEQDAEEDDPPPPPPPPPLKVKVGDYVQWTSDGVDQFKPARKVLEILPDGVHAVVFGSKTGIPMSDLTVVDPPKAIEPISANSAYRADNAESKSDYLVLMRGDRLEITADVDAAGLEKLQAMLAKYAEILKLMS